MKYEGKLEGREYQPRAARIDVAYDAVVQSEWGVVEAKVLNVSNKGFRLRSHVELAPGTEVTIEVAKLQPVQGIIQWACGDECGGVFVEAVAL